MTRSFTRDSVVRTEVDRVNELNTGRINKRKYYGVKTEIEEYKDKIDFHVNHTGVSEALDRSVAGLESVVLSESLIDDVVESADLLREGVDEVVESVSDPVRRSFEKGTRRAFDQQGDTLPSPDDVGDRVRSLVDEQSNYVSELLNDLRGKAREFLKELLGSDVSKSQLKERLDSDLKDLKDNRASTIAESENVKAAGRGVEETFDANDVDRVQWVAEVDERSCEPGAFEFSKNGVTYSSCPELDEQVFDRNGVVPRPVEDTHPNCRCVLVGVTE